MSGLLYTLEIALLGTLIGFLIGLLVAVLRTIPISKTDPLLKKALLRLLRAVLNIYIEVFRGTPMMVQAMFIYYGLAQLFNIHLGTM